MANVQEIKADKTTKTLRLFVIVLLVVGFLAAAASIVDLAGGHILLKLFGNKSTAVNTNFSGIAAAELLLAMSGVLLVVGSIMYLVKKVYRSYLGTCVAAIIFALIPFIVFAVNIGSYLFALIFALLALAIIVLAIFAMKSRWQVYIKEMTGEVKKLTWLTMKELVKATAVVLVFVLAFALLIYVLDLIFYTPARLLLTGSETPAATAEPAQEQAQPAANDGAEDSTND